MSEVKLTFAGDASALEKATAIGRNAAERMASSVESSGSKLEKSFTSVNSSAELLADGVAGLGSSLQAITDIQYDNERRADRLARAHNDVAQAAADVEQAFIDSAQSLLDWEQAARDTAQSEIDLQQAQLDLEVAQKDYNDAVKEFGPNSLEARQALIDQQQAVEDLNQANLDAKQAEVDRQQYTLDGKQASIDATDAQLNLNEARRVAVPTSDLQTWAEKISAIAPIALTAMGAIQLMTTSSIASSVASGAASAATGIWTGVQWLLNAAFWANPITWVVAGIVALIAVIVLIATKTTWFQDAWNAVWGGIKSGAKAIGDWFSGPFVDFFRRAFEWVQSKATAVQDFFWSVPGRIKSAFANLVDIITWPFRTAFNKIADLWNNSVGDWSIPDWVPGLGGKSMPKIPKFHSGIDRVPGAPGQEILAILEAGERVTSRADVEREVARGGDTYNLTLNVSLEDLAQLKEFEAFVVMIKNNARRGLVVS